MNENQNLIERINLAVKVIERSLAYKVYIKEIPALAVGIVYKDKLVFSKGFGFADLEKKIKVTAESCFRIASISKVFTATAIMQLVEKEKLRLDDKVVEHLDWFKSSKDKDVERITIRQLLTHTSGIQRDGDTPHWVSHSFPEVDYLKKYVADLVLPCKPNTKWKYSNFGFAVLGEVVKVVSNESSYEAYIKKNITDKLEMRLTSSLVDQEIKARLVIGRGRKIPGKDREIFPTIETNAYAPATGFSSSVVDLAKFTATWFKGNDSLLTEESKRELFRIQWLREGELYNQAITFRKWRMDGRTYYSHSGGFPGYRANISFEPESKIGVIILMNVIGIDPSIYSKLCFHIINNLNREAEKVKSGKLLDFSKYEGLFRSLWNDLQVISFDQRLIIYDPSSDKPLQSHTDLEPIKDDIFKIKSDKWEKVGEPAKFVFDTKSNLKTVVIGSTPYEKVNLY